MNRLEKLFEKKDGNILNIYFTAGYPGLEDTVPVIKALDQSGVDMVEIGIPYSDPLADGPTIQESGAKALENGITLDLLFEQIAEARKVTDMPFVLMGYYNPVIQYGEERFLDQCTACGVDGLIIPDLPLHEYEEKFKEGLAIRNIKISFLITPMTTEERIKEVDRLSSGFVYMVSNSAITGAKGDISNLQIDYFRRVRKMGLTTPRLIGFGISNYQTFQTACQYANGAIVGSAFISALRQGGELKSKIQQFIKSIKNPS